MTWADVTLQIRMRLAHHAPEEAWDAIEEVSRLMRLTWPDVIGHPERILSCDPAIIFDGFEQVKPLKDLECQVVDLLFAVVGQKHKPLPVERGTKKSKPAAHKLKPLADCLSKIFEQFFNCSVSYAFEVQPQWLCSVPEREQYEAVWQDISDVYGALVDDLWTLDARLEIYAGVLRNGQQRTDIWFDAPLNCMVEFDETQHFNQYRLRTLQHGYEKYGFDDAHYLALASATELPPGTTPFHRLRNFDPLFPPMTDGEAQDNRMRQRAFRDFLKDITPVVMPEVNPTIRISYATTHGRIKAFKPEDLEAVEVYLKKTGVLGRMKMFDNVSHMRSCNG